MKGDVVTTADGTQVTLVDVGVRRIFESEVVRVWDVVLDAGGHHPWHLHHNPYIVLSVAGSTGRMDWIDGRESRHIKEYSGGAVLRPVSPVHCLTNTGDTRYRNRLIELLDLGEKRAEGPLHVEDLRSIEGKPSTVTERPAPEWEPVIGNELITVWTVSLRPGERTSADLGRYAVVAELDADLEETALDASVGDVESGAVHLINDGDGDRTWFVAALSYVTTTKE